ncbi:MAG: alpha-L-rhamnosidase C-terminal domain-containing protein [Planctomycetota bacterium]
MLLLLGGCTPLAPSREDSAAGTAAIVDSLRCEYLEDPLGLDVPAPRLSWKLRAPGEERGVRQIAYRILVASSAEKLARDEGDRWDSGRVESAPAAHVEFGGGPLPARAVCHWKVRVWTAAGAATAWSASARWTMGLLAPSYWSAQWIGAAPPAGVEPPPDPWLRRVIEVEEPPTHAFAYVASVGYHELFVNGHRAGDGVLMPPISDLSRRARTVAYDLAGLLRPGRNALHLRLSGGWGRFPAFGRTDAPLVRAQIAVTRPDGAIAAWGTDERWKVQASPRRVLGEWRFGRFGGERMEGEDGVPAPDPGDDDSAWPFAATYAPALALSAAKIEPNRALVRLDPVAVEEREPGVWRFDLGRGFTGTIELDGLRGEPGATVAVSVSERAEEECTYDQRSEIVLSRGGPAPGTGSFRSRSNYVCGRWITVRGVAKAPAAAAHLVRTDFRRIGRFECSDELLNRVYDTALWTLECLSLGGYVVDCAHRERQGYGGDAHATMETALANYDVGAFYTKWLEDWRDVQGADGDLPYTAPTYEGGGGPAWSGVCVTLPWEVYLAYGDARVLEENYPMMRRWLAFLATQCDGELLHCYGPADWGFLGDWVPPGRQQNREGWVDDRSTLFFNNCYRFYVVGRMARIAEILGKHDDAARYRDQAAAIRGAVHAEFYDPSTATYANGEQPYLAFPLLAGLTPPALRPAVTASLEREILVAKGGHVDAGIHGTYFLLKHLTEAGRSDLVYEMVAKTDYPGWGHMLAEGATTFWEQWDGIHSRCHSSFLSVGAWFLEGVLGIRVDPEHPGYERFLVQPSLIGDLTWARGEIDTIRGLVEVAWRREGGRLHLTVSVPPNATAEVHVPTADPAGIREGGRPAAAAEGVRLLRQGSRNAVFEVLSGSYEFRAASPR